MRFLRWWLCAGLIGGSAGCALISEKKAEEGQEVFDSLQAAVVAAAAGVEESVVLVVPEGMQPAENENYEMVGGAVRRAPPRGMRAVNGVILTVQGHILIPGVLKPEDVERLTVWAGAVEYPARVVKADEQLGMTIIKLRTEDELVPLARDRLADLQTGSWYVTVRQSNEERDFARFTNLGVCRGEIAGRYREFDTDNLSNEERGAPVVDLNGALVGFADRGNVISITDLNEDLQDFLDQATGVTSPEEEALRKGWLGVMLMAVNKEYAQAHDLPRSGLWVTHVVSAGAGAAAGIQVGDLIIALNGQPLQLSGQRALSYFMKALRPRVGCDFEVTVIRDAQEVVCRGVFAKVPEDEKLRARDIGIEVKSITESDVFEKNLFTAAGVLVTDVEGGSPAATSSTFRSGLLRANDVILEIAGQPTPNLKEFGRVLDDVRREKPEVLLVFYQRGLVTGYAGLNLKIGENGKRGDQ